MGNIEHRFEPDEATMILEQVVTLDGKYVHPDTPGER